VLIEVPLAVAARELHRARRALAGFLTAFDGAATTLGGSRRPEAAGAAAEEGEGGPANRDPNVVTVPCAVCGAMVHGLWPTALEQHMAEHHPAEGGGDGGGGGGGGGVEGAVGM
jgi:hypothetical protein